MRTKLLVALCGLSLCVIITQGYKKALCKGYRYATEGGIMLVLRNALYYRKIRSLGQIKISQNVKVTKEAIVSFKPMRILILIVLTGFVQEYELAIDILYVCSTFNILFY